MRSHDAADVQASPGTLRLDWFYLGPHVLADATSAAALWSVALAATLLLLALPWLHRAPRAPAAQVTPERCNGCGRWLNNQLMALIILTTEPRCSKSIPS